MQAVLGDLTPICLHPKLNKILAKPSLPGSLSPSPFPPLPLRSFPNLLSEGPIFEKLSEKPDDRIPIRIAFLGAPQTGKTSVIQRFTTGGWEERAVGGAQGEVAETVVVGKHKETGKVFEFTMLDFGSEPEKVDVGSLKGCHAVVVMMSLLVQVGGVRVRGRRVALRLLFSNIFFLLLQPKEKKQECFDSIAYLKKVFPFYSQLMSSNTQLGMGKPHLIMLGTKSDMLEGEVVLPRPPFPTLTSALRFAGI